MSLSRSYAEALHLAYNEVTPSQAIDSCLAIAEEMKQAALAVQESKDLSIALYSAATTAKEKTGILISLMDLVSKNREINPIRKKFVEIVAQKGRVKFLDEISVAIEQAVISSQGGISGIVYSVDPLDQQEILELKGIFEKKYSRKISLSCQTDETLIAGLKIKIAGVTYDGSLKGQLNRMKEFLVNKN